MNNFPTRAIPPKNIKDTGIPLLKEYAWDFEKDEIILDKHDKFIIVEGVEALKVRNYLSLRIYKGRFFIYKNTGSDVQFLKNKQLYQYQYFV